jgi:anti-anti-sigma regulatory factor
MGIAVTGTVASWPRTTFSVDVVDSERRSARLRAVGRLDRLGGDMLAALLTAQQEAGVRYLRLDVSGVTGVDTAGLAALTSAHQRFLDLRGTLVLTSLSQPLLEAVTVAQLDDVLLTVKAPATPIQAVHP